jgi:hypothetical protein
MKSTEHHPGDWNKRIPHIAIRWRTNKNHEWKYDVIPTTEAEVLSKRIKPDYMEIIWESRPKEEQTIEPINFEASTWNLRLLRLLYDAHENKHNSGFAEKYAAIFTKHWEERGKTYFGEWGMGYATYLETLAGIDPAICLAMTKESHPEPVETPEPIENEEKLPF